MIYKIGPFELDIEQQELRESGKNVPIQKKVFELLRFLIENRDRALTKDEIQTAVWPGTIVSETAITRAILKARRALNDDANDQLLIKTVHGHGYRFVGTVLEADASDHFRDDEQMVSERRADMFKVLAAYGAIAWFINQIAAMVWEAFEFDKLPLQILLGVSLAGVPVALGLTWWYRFTEDGLRRRDELGRHEKLLASKYNYVVVAGILLASLLITVLWQLRSVEMPAEQVAVAPIAASVGTNRVAVLPLINNTGDQSYGWTRLGLMSLLNQKVAESGLPTVPSRSLIQMFNEDPVVDDSLLARLGQVQGAATIVAPVLNKAGETLSLDLIVFGSTGEERIEVSGDVIPTELVMLASNKLLPLLNPYRTQGIYRSGTSADPFVNEIYARGLYEELSGNLEEARNLFKVAVSQDPEFFLARYEYAITTRYLGDFDEAEPLLDELVVAAEELKNPLYQTLLANARGVLYDLKGDMDKAESIYIEGLKIAEQYKVFSAQANLLVNYAIIEKGRGNLGHARELLGRAIDASQRAELVVSGAVYITLANIAVNEGDMDSAGKNYLQALENYRLQESPSGEAIALSNLSWLAQREHRFDDSLRLLKESNDIRERIGDRVGRLKGLVREGAIHYELGQFDLCRETAKQILASDVAQDQSDFKATALTYLGMVAAHLGDAEAAKANLNEAIEIRESRQDVAGVLRTQNLLVEAHLLARDFSSAKALIKAVIDRASSLNLKTSELGARMHEAKMLASSGDRAGSIRLFESLLPEVRATSDSAFEKQATLDYITVLLLEKQTQLASSLLLLLDDTEPDRSLRLVQAELAFQQDAMDRAVGLMQEAKALSFQRWTTADDEALTRYLDTGQNL